MSGRSDPENVLRDNAVSDSKSDVPSLSPLSLSSCARLVQFSSETSPTKNNDLHGTPGFLSSPTTDQRTSGGFKLDLPLVYNSLKYSNFRGTTKESFLVTKRRRRNIEDSLKELNLDECPTGNGLNTPAIDRSLAEVRSARRNKNETIFGSKKIEDQAPSSTRADDKVIRKNVEDRGNRKNKQKKEMDSVRQKFEEIFTWARSHTATSKSEIKRMTEDWEQYAKATKVTSLHEIADLFSIPASNLQDFQLDDLLDLKLNTVIQKLRSLISHLVYPDLLKIQAFREWQNDKGNLNKCAYYLAESHGTHLRSDIVDKHCLFFCKKEELTKAEPGSSSPVDDKLRKKVFVHQIKDAITFGRKFDDFTSCLSEINPNWNVIQITALAFGNNRFGSDAADYRHTPPLFLSSFVHLHGDPKRSTFVNYVKHPEIDPSSRILHGILEEFKKVMAKNRHINDEYHGCRKQYWDIRAEHNKHLSDILDAIEENWLAPFSLLLPGNIKDISIQARIVSKLSDIQQAAGTKLTGRTRVFLYKLMENYGLISSKIKYCLQDILAEFLQISAKRAAVVNEIVTRVGEEIPENQDRWPTVLILDSELEQLPWDWLPSLRTTSVTRMASVAAIHSSMRIMHISRPKYPEIVDISKCTFILNPDQSLANVQKRLESYLKGHKKWKGIISRKPTFQEMEDALQNNDVMLYCGHGSGINFFPEFALQKLLCNATPILMGCSSAQYRYQGPKANSSSIVTSYLIAACPSIVGYLWEVTDVECDRVTVDMLQRWLPGPKKLPAFPHFDPKLNRPREKCLATAMLRSRKAATQFLTEAALVNYGLPIETK